MPPAMPWPHGAPGAESARPPGSSPAATPQPPFDPTLVSSQGHAFYGIAPPSRAGAPPRVEEPASSPRSGGTPLGGTLTVSPSAKGADPSSSRPAAASGSARGRAGAQAPIPLAAKVGAVAGAVTLTVVILVLTLRSGGGEETDPPASIEASPPSVSAPPSSSSEAPPPRAVGAPVEGVIEIGEGEEMPEAITSDPELMSQMDAGAGKPAPWIPPIPYGKARLIVTSKEGPCKVTVNAIPQGVTPVHIFVTPGKTRVYCRLSTGSTRSKDVDVPARRTTFVIFERKPGKD